MFMFCIDGRPRTILFFRNLLTSFTKVEQQYFAEQDESVVIVTLCHYNFAAHNIYSLLERYNSEFPLTRVEVKQILPENVPVCGVPLQLGLPRNAMFTRVQITSPTYSCFDMSQLYPDRMQNTIKDEDLKLLTTLIDSQPDRHRYENVLNKLRRHVHGTITLIDFQNIETLLKQTLVDKDQLDKECKKMMENNTHMASVIATFQQRSSMDQQQEWEMKIRDLSAKYAGLSLIVDGYKSQVDGLTMTLRKRDETVASLEEQIEKMRQKETVWNTQANQVIERIHNLVQQEQAMRLENEKLKDEVCVLQNQCDQLKMERDMCRNQSMEQMCQQYFEAMIQLNMKQTEIDRLHTAARVDAMTDIEWAAWFQASTQKRKRPYLIFIDFITK